MNMVKSGLAWARTQLKTNVATSVKIRRGALTSATITAIKAGPEADQYDDAGAFVQRVRQLDWLIDPADYKLAGEVTFPEDDDLIDELDASGAVVATYAVSSPTPGENPWRYTDGERTWLRVHANED